ncbi:MAG: ABC transporter permease, partial [Alicyclobacillus sp.]|nr:ABC transporter permease [Alicyclobacillus sp.]
MYAQLKSLNSRAGWFDLHRFPLLRRFSKSRLALCGAVWMLLMVLVAVFAPRLAPYSYGKFSLAVNQPPSTQYPFGTDEMGRDLRSLLLYAIRYAMEIASMATAVAFVIGVTIGLISGLSNRFVDQVLMRLTDAMYVFPAFYMAMVLVVDLGKHVWAIALSIGFVTWASFARLARGLTLSIRNTELMEAGRAAGASTFYLARWYVLPMIVNSMIVYTAFTMANAMIQEAYLDFLGMGLPSPMPSFGLLLYQSARNLDGFPWQFWPPAIVFMGTLVALVFIGDGLQAAL